MAHRDGPQVTLTMWNKLNVNTPTIPLKKWKRLLPLRGKRVPSTSLPPGPATDATCLDGPGAGPGAGPSTEAGPSQLSWVDKALELLGIFLYLQVVCRAPCAVRREP